MPVYYSQHVRDKTDSEQVVGIGEETNTGHDDGANMVPAERSLVNFGKSKSSALIWILDVSLCGQLVSIELDVGVDRGVIHSRCGSCGTQRYHQQYR